MPTNLASYNYYQIVYPHVFGALLILQIIKIYIKISKDIIIYVQTELIIG